VTYRTGARSSGPFSCVTDTTQQESRMGKIISLLKPEPGLDPIHLKEYWRETYLNALLALPGVTETLLRILYNQVQPTLAGDHIAPTGWEAVSEMWFANRSASEALLSNNQLLRGDAASLQQIVHLHVREVMMWDRGGKHDALKMMVVFSPRAGMTREQAQRYWNVEHVSLGVRHGIDRKFSKYVQNHTFADYHSPDRRFDYAGGPEAWFNDIADFNRLLTDDALMAALAADEAMFMDRNSAEMMLLEEELIYEGHSLRDLAN